jgi:hypothetical protein
MSSRRCKSATRHVMNAAKSNSIASRKQRRRSLRNLLLWGIFKQNASPEYASIRGGLDPELRVVEKSSAYSTKCPSKGNRHLTSIAVHAGCTADDSRDVVVWVSRRSPLARVPTKDSAPPRSLLPHWLRSRRGGRFHNSVCIVRLLDGYRSFFLDLNKQLGLSVLFSARVE